MIPRLDRQMRPFRADDDDEQQRAALADRFEHVYTTPSGARVFANIATTTRQAAADAARLDVLDRARGHHEAEGAPLASEPVWSRTPSPAQLAARDEAFASVMASWPLVMNDAPVPAIAWRWLYEDDDPTMARAWGFCRVVAPGQVQIAINVTASPERVFRTCVHELQHAADHELLYLGAPRELLEQRAERLQQLLRD